MNWDWLDSAGTVVVALAGIGATVFTGGQGRQHAEHLATEAHERRHLEMLRQERLKIYADALAHAVDQERRLNATWASDGEHALNLTPKPPGASLSLASRDEITVRILLLADGGVGAAWSEFTSAWEELQWWADMVHGGDPNEEAPENLTMALRSAIDRLKTACRASVA